MRRVSDMEPRSTPPEPRDIIDMEREHDCGFSGFVDGMVWGRGIEWQCPRCYYMTLEEDE
jgi:hypothetical protein